MSDAPASDAPTGKVRLDKWLWAARFFKTRALAAEAIDGGKVDVNGEKAKRSRLIAAGDRVEVRHGPVTWQVTVVEPASRRVSAQLAQEFYVESPEGMAARLETEQQLRSQPRTFQFGDSRPGKRDRRAIRRLKGDY